MKIKLLGTGTSSGVPLLGCDCEVCTSKDPRDRRLRALVMIEEKNTRVLIDCGPDIRQQLLNEPFRPFDGILLTHEHYDHVGGLDDLRAYCAFGPLHIYGEAYCVNHIRERMFYCFGDTKYPSAPSLELHEVKPLEPFQVGDLTIIPLRVLHGEMPIVGYRIGSFAYITDMKTLPQSSFEALQGVSTLVINGLRHRPHASHQTIEDAVDIVERLNVSHAWLTHIAHSAGLHARSCEYLPSHIQFGYDGLEFFV